MFALNRIVPPAADRIKRTVQLDASTVEIEERGVKLRYSGVDRGECGQINKVNRSVTYD